MPIGTNHVGYHEYLLGRNWKAKIYRRFWLYPRLNARLPGRTLDVGCGIGDFLEYRARVAAPGTSVGIDINPVNIEFCQKRGLKDVYVTEGADWDFLSAGSFDSVILDNVIEHLDDPKDILRNIARVLRPGGKYLVGSPGKRAFGMDEDHKVFYDTQKMLDVTLPFGFKLVEEFHTPFKSLRLQDSLKQYCYYWLFERI